VITIPVTVCVPTIPPRVDTLLTHALSSVQAQTLQPECVVVVLDATREGAAATRQKALNAVRTEWVAYLDDDDAWYPHHLETLFNLAQEHDAEYVYSWFDGNSPFPGHRGKQMNLDEPHHTTMGIMVKTWLSQEAGFIPHPEAPPEWAGEDWYHQVRCIEILRAKYGDELATGKFAGTGEVTWTYRLHGRNTSGRPRW
jgi:glycosyltransferase involved in cell wall biosynthesis